MSSLRLSSTFHKRDGFRNDHNPLNPTSPLRTFVEVAKIVGMKPDEVKYLEKRALRKMRAALSCWGYNPNNK